MDALKRYLVLIVQVNSASTLSYFANELNIFYEYLHMTSLKCPLHKNKFSPQMIYGLYKGLK